MCCFMSFMKRETFQQTNIQDTLLLTELIIHRTLTVNPLSKRTYVIRV